METPHTEDQAERSQLTARQEAEAKAPDGSGPAPGEPFETPAEATIDDATRTEIEREAIERYEAEQAEIRAERERQEAADAEAQANQVADGWATPGYDGPQPWEVVSDEDAKGLHDDPGSPNKVAPVVLEHSHPILTSGSQGPDVAELCRLLKLLGYETPVSRGENVFAVAGPGELAAVQRFRADYGVSEDPAQFPEAGGEKAVGNHVGPYTWEALDRAVAAQA